MLKGFGLRNSNQKLKKVVPVDSSSSALMYARDHSPQPPKELFDVNMLDYMGLDDFLEVMHSKVEDNSGALWMATKSLARQLKSSKALLSISSLFSSGKSCTEIMDSLLESSCFILKCQYAYLFEFVGEDLVVTYSNDKKSIGKVVSHSNGIYGDVISERKCVSQQIGDDCDPSLCGTAVACRTMLCAPVTMDKSVCGIFQVCHSRDLDLSGASLDDSKGIFDINDELMIGFIASHVGILVNIVSNKEKYNRSSTCNDEIEGALSNSGNLSEAVDFDKELKALEISETFTAEAPSETLLEKINGMIGVLVNDLYAYLKVERISIFLRKGGAQYLECVVSKDIQGSRIPLGSGFTGLVMNSNKVMMIPDAGVNSQHYSKFDNLSKFKTENVLCGPLRLVDGLPFGVVEALNKKGDQFSERDEKYIEIMCSKLSVFYQMAQEMEQDTHNRVTCGGLAKFLNKLLSCNSLKSLADVAKKEVLDKVSCDCVDLFVFEPSDGCPRLRKLDHGEGSTNIYQEAMQMQLNQMRQIDAAVPEKSTAIPMQILDAIRTGVQCNLSIDDQSATIDKLVEYLGTVRPDMPPFKSVLVCPIGSNASSGLPATHVLLVGRIQDGTVPFNSHDCKMLDICADLMGNAIDSLRKVKDKDLQLKNMSFHFNMVISALSLLHKYVILLDKYGDVIACNRSIDGLLGKIPRSANGHISKWFEKDQAVVLDDILSVLNNGVPIVSGDDVTIVTPDCPDGLSISYQVCAVNSKGTILQEAQTEGGAEIQAVIVILRVNAVMESDAPEVDSAIVTNATGLQESLKTVVDSLASIVGDYKLDVDDHKVVTRISSDIMTAGRNIQLSIRQGPVCSKEAKELVEIVEHSVAESPLLICPEALAIEDLFTWEFDVMLYKSQTTLRGILFLIFQKMFNFAEININVRTLCAFFQEVEKHYHLNPFHNFYHITCVTHFAYMLISSSEAHKFVSVTNLFAVMLSAVVHDIDHPGNSNLFEINSQSELALLYNDQSVLENHHCSTAFRIMRNKNMDVLEDMLDAKDVKKTMVSCIMATDMSVHFDLIEKVKRKISDGWDFSDSNDTFFLCRILLHAADLSNPVRPYHMSKYWASKITEEFNQQVELERSLNLPVLGFMITSDEKSFCKNEIGFASFVVAPMWRSLELLFPAFKPLVVQLDKNLDTWKQMLVEIAAEEEAAHTSSLSTK